MIPYDISEWGQRIHMADGTWGTFHPDKWMIHWPGSAFVTDPAAAFRNIERYHIDHNGWKTIAYNYGISPAGAIYRLRGENQSGATSGDLDLDGIPENKEARAVLFLTNSGPTPAQEASFKRLWAADPLPVYGHRQVRILSGAGTITQCPGDGLMKFIGGRSWNTPVSPPLDIREDNTMGFTTSNPGFQTAWDKAVDNGTFTKFTTPSDVVTAEKLAVFFDRAGVFDAPAELGPFAEVGHTHTGTCTCKVELT